MRALVPAIVLCTAGAAARAQQDPVYAHVPLRVVAAEVRGRVVVDRGGADGLATGDVVMLFPGGGAGERGFVVEVAERTAVVELQDRTLAVAPGMRGEALVPRSRREPQRAPVPEAARPERPPVEWTREDAWQPDRPLLAGVEPLRPEQRRAQIHGRVFLTGALTHDRQSDFDNSFGRVGTAFDVDNPFGSGGALQFDGELNYRTEHSGFDGSDLLVRRASYAWGGHRFEPDRVEVGRFLQQVVPELGVLDGVQWVRRTERGNRVGAGFGFMPELGEDFDSFRDLQVSAFYEWSPDLRRTLTLTAGVQKTWHDGESDRDLLVARGRWAPAEGWDLHGSAWIDFYTGNEAAERSDVEITQALVSATRSWDDGTSVGVGYRRQSIPDLLRDEFLQPPPADLAGDHYDEVSTSLWLGSGFHAFGSAWIDEDHTGGALELGQRFDGPFGSAGFADVSGFGNHNEFTDVVGLRLTHTIPTGDGLWDVLYEISAHRNRGFTSDRDDILQNRLRIGRSLSTAGGWDVSIHAEARTWDDEVSAELGFWVQRRF